MKKRLICVLFCTISAGTFPPDVKGEEWVTLYETMMTHYKARALDSAEVWGERALQAARASRGSTDSSVAMVLHRLGSIYRARPASWELATEYYLEAISIWEQSQIPHPTGLSKSLSNLGELLTARGMYVESEEYQLRAVELKENLEPQNLSSLALSHSHMADLYWKMGLYSVAEQRSRTAIDIYRQAHGQGHHRLLQALNTLGVIFYVQRRFDEAIPIFKEVLEGYKKLDNPVYCTGLYANLSISYGSIGDLSRSIALAEEGLSVIEDHDLNIPGINAMLIRNLGFVYRQQGQLDRAEEVQDNELALLLGLYRSDHPEVLLTQYNQANLYRDTDRPAPADSLYRYVFNSRREKLGPRHPDVGHTLLSWSRLKERQGEFDSAFSLAYSASEIHTLNYYAAAPLLSERDALKYSHDMKAAGQRTVAAALRIREPSEDIIARAADIVCNIKGPVSDGIYLRNKRSATNQDDSIKEQVEKFFEIKRQLVRAIISPPVDLDDRSQSAYIDSLTDLANQLEREIVVDRSDFLQPTGFEQVQAEEVCEAVPKGACLIEYLRLGSSRISKKGDSPSEYIVLVLDTGGVSLLQSLGSAEHIDSIIASYRLHMIGVAVRGTLPTHEDMAEYNTLASSLYSLLWKPMEKYIALDALVLVAPDGALNLLSFAGLKDGADHYLVEKYTIHYLGAGRDVLRFDQDSPVSTGLLAIGNPDYDATAADRKEAIGISSSEPGQVASMPSSNLRSMRSGCGKITDISVSPLPGSQHELDLVRKSWLADNTNDPIDLFIGAAASEDNLRRSVAGKRAIHITTHGFYLGKNCEIGEIDHERQVDTSFLVANPLIYSGLIFAGGNLHGEGALEAGVDDGILTAEEVSLLNLEGVRSVVLSACETGLGDIKNGEGVWGLRRAFQMAGARTVVSTLWRIPDQQTTDFMAGFYRHSSESVPERIRRMQVEQIQKYRTIGMADHPFAWGAFIATGAWR